MILDYTYRSSISSKGSDTRFRRLFFAKLQRKLSDAYIFDIQSQESVVSFKGTVFRFAWNGWNLFNGISKGEIRITKYDDKRYLYYKINFLEVFVIASIFTIIPFTLYDFPDLMALAFVAVWIVYFINYVISSRRLKTMLFEIIKDIDSEIK